MKEKKLELVWQLITISTVIQIKETKNQFMEAIHNKKITTCVLQKFLFEYRTKINIMDYIDILYEFIDNYSSHGKNLYT